MDNIDRTGEERIMSCGMKAKKAWGYYLKEKQQIIKNIAEEYKDKIPNKLYNKLIEISNEEGKDGI